MFGFGSRPDWMHAHRRSLIPLPPGWPGPEEDEDTAKTVTPAAMPANAPATIPQRPLSFAPAPTESPTQASAAGPGGGLGGFLSGINGDALLALGAGLMSGKNWGEGLSRGVDGMQRANYVAAQAGIAQNKLNQQQAGRNRTIAYLKSLGATDEEAAAGAADRNILNSILTQKNRDPMERRAKELDIQKKEQDLKGVQYRQEKDEAGNIWQVNPDTQKREMIYTAPKPEAPPSSVKEYEYSQKVPGYLPFLKQQAEAGSTKVNIDGGDNKQVFSAVQDSHAMAKTAAIGLAGLQEARKAIEAGAITGSFADQRLALQKAGAALGITDPAKIQNTETFRAAIAPQISAVLKSTVGTANISNSDREFAEKAAGGSIQLDAGSITRLMSIMEKASMARIQEHNDMLSKVYPDAAKNSREHALFGVRLPEASAPQRRAPAADPLGLFGK